MAELYRHFDSSGKLLYVGVSKSALIRLGQHQEHAHWFGNISQVTIEKHPSREAALEAERLAIQSENPLCNVQHRSPSAHTVRKRQAASLELAKKSATALTQSLVWFNTTYTPDQIADRLSISSAAAKRLIENREIGSIELEDKGRTVRRVTGWQLIEFLESREQPAAKKGGSR